MKIYIKTIAYLFIKRISMLTVQFHRFSFPCIWGPGVCRLTVSLTCLHKAIDPRRPPRNTPYYHSTGSITQTSVLLNSILMTNTENSFYATKLLQNKLFIPFIIQVSSIDRSNINPYKTEYRMYCSSHIVYFWMGYYRVARVKWNNLVIHTHIQVFHVLFRQYYK